MIAAVREAILRLGAATRSEIQAETGLPDWQVEHCLEHLLRRGDIQSAAAAAGSCRARPKPATACRHCPLEAVCPADTDVAAGRPPNPTVSPATSAATTSVQIFSGFPGEKTRRR